MRFLWQILLIIINMFPSVGGAYPGGESMTWGGRSSLRRVNAAAASTVDSLGKRTRERRTLSAFLWLTFLLTYSLHCFLSPKTVLFSLVPGVITAWTIPPTPLSGHHHLPVLLVCASLSHPDNTTTFAGHFSLSLTPSSGSIMTT